jgi:hypothetical protein
MAHTDPNLKSEVEGILADLPVPAHKTILVDFEQQPPRKRGDAIVAPWKNLISGALSDFMGIGSKEFHAPNGAPSIWNGNFPIPDCSTYEEAYAKFHRCRDDAFNKWYQGQLAQMNEAYQDQMAMEAAERIRRAANGKGGIVLARQ